MENKRNMTKSHITAKLRSYLKKHVNELQIVIPHCSNGNVTSFNICLEEEYSGKDYYPFSGQMEFYKDGMSQRTQIRSKVYIEEGEDNEPQFSNVDTIFPL